MAINISDLWHVSWFLLFTQGLGDDEENVEVFFYGGNQAMESGGTLLLMESGGTLLFIFLISAIDK